MAGQTGPNDPDGSRPCEKCEDCNGSYGPQPSGHPVGAVLFGGGLFGQYPRGGLVLRID
jgi:hypothetical protein